MKKIKFILKNSLLLAILGITIISCERDFNRIGSGIIGDNNFETTSELFPVITYNQNIGPIQTNSLPINMLGVNNHPVYGSYKVDFVSQMAPTAFDPTFGQNIVLDSVILIIPYFSTLTDTDEDGNRTFELDSVFGDTPINLSIYRNNYFLRDFDPESEFNDPQKYFSNKSISEGEFITQSDLESELLYQDTTFEPSAEEIITTVLQLDENGDVLIDEDGEPVVGTTTRLVPSLRARLDVDSDEDPSTFVFQNPEYYSSLIFDKEGEPELSNLNNFSDYFRGLFFKVSSNTPDGSLALIDFTSTNAHITYYYTSETENDDDTGGDTEVTTENGTYVLNFTGTRANFIENNLITIPDGDTVNGDENLYLKGGEGAMAIVNLFKGDSEGDSPELDQFLADFRKLDSNGDFVTGNDGQFLADRLVNEANLVFYVNQNLMTGTEPDRVIIYDLNNDTVLIDYLLDQSASTTQIGAKIDHLHPLERVDDEPDGEGIKYKIEITEHINNILLRDSTNTKLGLLVTGNIQAIERFNLQDDENIVQSVISGSILSPRGTVLFGNNIPEGDVNEDKKVKLEIYYTEPDN